MESERRKKLMETMKKVNKDHKDTLLKFGKEIEDLELIPTGIQSIDKFLGGGIKRGTHTIFWGDMSNGKTTLTLQTIASAQKLGHICCYINLEKPIDQKRFEQLGVNLEDLVVVNCPKNAEKALTVIKELCNEKVIDLFIVDSINALSPQAEQESKKGVDRGLEEKTIAELARLLSEFCRRVNSFIYNAKASVVWIGQLRIGGIGTFFTRATLSGGKALKFYAYQIVYMRKGQTSDAPVNKVKKYFCDPDGKVRYKTEKEPCGFDSVFRMDKTNASESAKENIEVHFPFIGDKGFVDSFVPTEDGLEIDAKNDEEENIIKEHLSNKGIGIIKEDKPKDKEVSEEKPQKKRGRPPKKKE